MEKQRVLVVDDDIDLCASLRVLFENSGYDVLAAGNRTEGMEKARTERPDLIVLDAMMETWQDGFDMSRQLRSDPTFRAVPILMLTSIEARTGIELKSTAGDPTWLPVDGFLSKPASPDVLLAEVSRLLQGSGASRPITSVPAHRGSAASSGPCPSGRLGGVTDE